jgi:hypothetical protein
VTGAPLEQYTRRYDSHMAATKSERDSLRSAMDSLQSAFRSGDRSVAVQRRQALMRQSDDLAKKDKQFEAGVKDLLSRDQQQRYTKWQEEQENLAHERHRDRGDHMHDAPRPQG